ncbi:MAG: GIY-YIG nuclease family protein [Lachnospiraceae bacterium]|nr:GIY-YIG nuclease family protein [Lachnospiraceae bacterium]
MPILSFADVLNKVGLEPSKVKLIRHALTDRGFKDCYEKDMVLEYTCQQKVGFSKNYDYWAVFISDTGNYAKLFGLYQVGNAVSDTPDVMPVGFPHPEWFQGKNAFFDLQHVNTLQEYEGRLIIDWGKSARMWHQKGTTEKPIVAIRTDNKKVFSGFENLILKYDELKEIVENPTIYDSWHTALSSVNAIYLIVDTETGKQYVGSAYGKDGLFGRWACYVNTLHGNNKEMQELICNYPDRYHYFQFSILQILPKTVTADDIIRMETLYKKKLMSISFGMNHN